MSKEKLNFALNSSLRNIYCTSRNKGAAVGIEFKHNGRLWRVDTVDEAVALRKRLDLEDQISFDSGEELPYVYREQVWTPDTVTDLLKNAGNLQKRFLRILADGRVTSENLVVSLGIDSEVSLAGVLSGLSKQLKKLGVKPSDLYAVEVSWTGKNKTRHFRLVNEFRWAATELGWPEKWPEN